MSTTTEDRKRLPFGSESGTVSTHALRNVAELGGRVLLAALFLISGLGKIGSYAATAGYLTSAGLAAALLPAVIATEGLGALVIVARLQTPINALFLAGGTLP